MDLTIGDTEPEPCQVLCSFGADVEAITNFNYIQRCVGPVEQAVLSCEGCGCQSRQCQAEDTSRPSCSCYIECCKGLTALQHHGRGYGILRLLECGPACGCDSSSCRARPTQHGVAVKLALYWNINKGWCVKALQIIPQGSFVAEYVGEYVTSSEAERRLAVYDTQQRGHALLVVRVELPSKANALKCCIDATRTGNVARFINHSCDGGNLEPIIVSSRGSLLPRVALFAARGIAEGEELSFSYAVSQQPDQHSINEHSSTVTRRCFCGTSACTGFLPRAA